MYFPLFPMCSHRGHQVLKLFLNTIQIAAQFYPIQFAQNSTLVYINWKGGPRIAHLSMKQGSLFCFVLFGQAEISQTTVPPFSLSDMLLATRERGEGGVAYLIHSHSPCNAPWLDWQKYGFFFLLGLEFFSLVPFSPPCFECFVLLTFGKFSSHCVLCHTLDIFRKLLMIGVQPLGLRLF